MPDAEVALPKQRQRRALARQYYVFADEYLRSGMNPAIAYNKSYNKELPENEAFRKGNNVLRKTGVAELVAIKQQAKHDEALWMEREANLRGKIEVVSHVQIDRDSMTQRLEAFNARLDDMMAKSEVYAKDGMALKLKNLELMCRLHALLTDNIHSRVEMIQMVVRDAD